jgi:hypothetical protein
MSQIDKAGIQKIKKAFQALFKPLKSLMIIQLKYKVVTIKNQHLILCLIKKNTEGVKFPLLIAPIWNYQF